MRERQFKSASTSGVWYYGAGGLRWVRLFIISSGRILHWRHGFRKSAQNLANYLNKKLMTDDEFYLSYFRWSENFWYCTVVVRWDDQLNLFVAVCCYRQYLLFWLNDNALTGSFLKRCYWIVKNTSEFWTVNLQFFCLMCFELPNSSWTWAQLFDTHQVRHFYNAVIKISLNTRRIRGLKPKEKCWPQSSHFYWKGGYALANYLVLSLDNVEFFDLFFKLRLRCCCHFPCLSLLGGKTE